MICPACLIKNVLMWGCMRLSPVSVLSAVNDQQLSAHMQGFVLLNQQL